VSSPILSVNRVVVEGDLGCNLRFEDGLNVVYSEPLDGDLTRTNRTGKTAMVELIQYGFGRRHESRSRFHFAPIMNKLKNLWMEVSANSETITVLRSLQQLSSAASIYVGRLLSQTTERDHELVSVEDLSRLYLKLLGIPEVSVRRSSGEMENLTFPLLMRAFILHQDDSFGAILDKVQPDSRRKDIVGFLSGVTDLSRFPLEEELGHIQRRIEEQQNLYDSVWRFLQSRGLSSTLEAERRVAEAEVATETAIEVRRQIQNMIRDDAESNQQIDGRTQQLRSALLATDDELPRLDQELVALEQERIRLEALAASLRADHQRAERLSTAIEILSPIDFSVCPRCLLSVTPDMRGREDQERCMLCSRPSWRTSDDLPRAAFQAKDIEQQLEEARSVLADVQQLTQEARSRRASLHHQRASLSMQLNRETQAYVSPAVDRLVAAAEEVSRLEGEAAAARSLLGQARALDAIRQSLDELTERRMEIEGDLSAATRASVSRLSALREAYYGILSGVQFPDLRDIVIDPDTLMPQINGMLYTHYGAAFRGVAVVAYHVALLELALRTDTFFPRFLVIDTPAVGDLNEQTHTALLEYIAALPDRYPLSGGETNPRWQVILTTRHVVPSLEPYIRERISAPDRMLLRSRSQWRPLGAGDGR
jgi:hypothetical protein